ncbi:serine/threonine-protein kinase [Pseudonocardia sp. TRM90224]|uniref:serine/threonine-protein kinase n=1 Tax=Pseudonocardia sp. TRM90224 TaxID=2812678 RepID=UPI001E3C87F3|nr:serine/threonine-protein kinase [Pseudonocardia sp. TRM90224]
MFPAIDHHPQLVAGRYRLVAKIGSGGMGTVWQAVDQLLGRTVALKRVRLDLVDPVHVAVTRERTMREARIAAALHHPNIVSIFDIVIDNDEPWLVMEYVPARTLAELLTEHRTLPWADVAAIGAQISAALAAAHHAGIVHRDVKPNNILITPPGPGSSVKLTDFGISHAAGSPAITSTGVLTGTPAYFAPETARTGETGPASDVYSLGATLYAATEGFPPFGDAGTNPLALLNRIATTDLPPPRNAGPLTALIQHLTARDPAMRPPAAQAQAVLHEIAMHLHHGGRSPTLVAPAARKRRGRALLLAGAALLTVLAVAAAAIVVVQNRPTGAAPAAAPTTTTSTPAPLPVVGPRAADPCGLIDIPALTSQFGPTEIVVGFEDFAECTADVTVGSQSSLLFVEFETAEQAKSVGIEAPTGAFPQVTPGVVTNHNVCRSRLFLDASTSVELSASPPEGSKLDSCAISSFSASAAEAILRRDGLPQRQPDNASPLAGLDACTLLTPAEVDGNAADRVVRYSGFAQWTCLWEIGNLTAEVVFVRDYEFSGYSQLTTVGAHSAATDAVDPERCDISLLQRTFAPAGAGDNRIEATELRLFGSKPGTAVCAEATRLATIIEGRLPAPVK